ncbi:hypothetical protein L596_023560 [Steinernema carpocapsae]|uniref:Protein kinase domain-containing protein n=1 Tax=Steinernema carpocapsae TaxID=34508 RepID=A0A4U5MET3_STECR|nr:hypothetical protein L596_023560 [Steinernema carpocapsae]
MKQHTLTEVQARSVIQQVLSALRYLSELQPPVIHYDLKPANILLVKENTLEVKITDFGLSKKMENPDSQGGIELTSPGAGTMWYLPPECFPEGPGGIIPTICSKVDVWSLGVVFYQILYGKKPFGHEESQKSIYQNKTISKSELVFPAKPSVSAHAQSFIKRCLQRKREERADFKELSDHPLFGTLRKREESNS